ncbi:MAG: hypothetical protein JW828_10145 [Sedimentisphaerales bacterium]|nr:hypothetical protein [Sedimentisphaerales bacterium]
MNPFWGVVIGILWPLGTALAAVQFPTSQQDAGFLRALEKQDQSYDPVEKMIRQPFSSPGYHTTLKGGMVHPTRTSLNYAVVLFDSGTDWRIERGKKNLARARLGDNNPWRQ